MCASGIEFLNKPLILSHVEYRSMQFLLETVSYHVRSKAFLSR